METKETKHDLDEEIISIFSTRLDYVMQLRDVTNRMLGYELSLSPSAISGYRTGRRSPAVADLVKIARFLDVSVDFLLGFTDELSPFRAK